MAERTCSNCGATAPPDARFCPQCGQPLGDSAPARDALSRYVPPELMHKLEQARASRNMTGERRIVTMLFCDVKGSTAMAETLDPEDWAEIMNGTFEHLIKPVYRYEGTLARLMGDAILAFFGAPIAHEDDPQRAVLAGLEIVGDIQAYRQEIKRVWGLDFNVRVGINTGLVVVGEVGSDLRVEYTAMGDAVNLAARMEQTAQPGTVQIAESTYRLVRRSIDCQPLGAIEVKGKQEPVSVYRPLALKSEPDQAETAGALSAPFSGRAEEMGQLSEALAGVLDGRGRLVGLIGEPGLGKSRLIRELHARFEADRGAGPPLSWNEVACLSYDSGRPYGLFHRHLRQLCAIADGAPAESIRSALERAAARLPLEWQGRALAIYQALLGARGDDSPTQAEAFQRELFEVAAQTYRALVGEAGGVLVFEDLHWADHASIEMLVHLLGLVTEIPMLMLCSLRSDPAAPAGQIIEGARAALGERLLEITLEPLDRETSDRLFDGLIAAGGAPPALREKILHKAGGNPFYIEEVVRSLIDEGLMAYDPSEGAWKIAGPLEDISVPASVQASVMARVDRLDDQARRVLQTAAVIGRSFYYRVLKGVLEADGWLDPSLAELQRLGLIVEQASQPEREFIFSHALTQEATYGAILKRVRRELHGRTGEMLEQLFPDQLDDQAALLGYHFWEARDPARAQPYFVRAGDRAARLYANADAADHYRRALAALDQLKADTPDLVHLYTRLGATLALASQFDAALAAYQDMAALAGERADPPLHLAALMEQATLRSTPTPVYDIAQAESLSRQALDLSRQTRDRVAETKILWNLMLLHSFDERVQESVNFGEKALALARELDLKDQIAFILNDLNRPYRNSGDMSSARAVLDESRQMWRAMGNLPMLTDNLGSTTSVLYMQGDYEQALAYGEEGVRISRETHNAWGQGFSQTGNAYCYFELGRIGEAIAAMDEAISIDELSGILLIQTAIRADLAVMYAIVGDIDHALALASQAVSRADDPSLPVMFKQWAFSGAAYVLVEGGERAKAESMLAAARVGLTFDGPTSPAPIRVLLAEARLALTRGDSGAALAASDALLGHLSRWQMRTFVADALLVKADALLALGQPDAAYMVLSEARATCEEIGARRAEWLVLARLSQVARQMAKTAEAEQLDLQARAVFDAVAASIPSPELRGRFLKLFPA